MDSFLAQCPPDMCADAAKELLERANGDVNVALQEAWNIKTAPPPEKTEWEKRRELADTATQEMLKVFKASKSHQDITE